jgi:hypothetical protein
MAKRRHSQALLLILIFVTTLLGAPVCRAKNSTTVDLLKPSDFVLIRLINTGSIELSTCKLISIEDDYLYNRFGDQCINFPFVGECAPSETWTAAERLMKGQRRVACMTERGQIYIDIPDQVYFDQTRNLHAIDVRVYSTPPPPPQPVFNDQPMVSTPPTQPAVKEQPMVSTPPPQPAVKEQTMVSAQPPQRVVEEQPRVSAPPSSSPVTQEQPKGQIPLEQQTVAQGQPETAISKPAIQRYCGFVEIESEPAFHVKGLVPKGLDVIFEGGRLKVCANQNFKNLDLIFDEDYAPVSITSGETVRALEIIPRYIVIPDDNRPDVSQVEYQNQAGTWVELKKRNTKEGYRFELPSHPGSIRLNLRAKDSPQSQQEIALNGKSAKISVDFGVLREIRFYPDYYSPTVALFKVGRDGNAVEIERKQVNEKGIVSFRSIEFRKRQDLQFVIEIIAPSSGTGYFFQKTRFGFSEIASNDNTVHLTEPSHFYLKFPGPVPAWFTLEGVEYDVSKNMDRQLNAVLLEWRYLENQVRFASLRPSDYPEFDVSQGQLPFELDRKKLQDQRLKFPVLFVDCYRRRSHDEPQEIEIILNGDGWEMPADIDLLKIISPYGETFQFSKLASKNKALFRLNACPQQNSSDERVYCLGKGNTFYHARRVKVIFEKVGFQRIEQSVDLSSMGIERSIVLDLLPLENRLFRINLVDENQHPINGYYYRIDDSNSTSAKSWQLLEKEKKVKHDGPMNLMIKSPGYKPKFVRLDQQGNYTIEMGTTELPLWIIIHAATPLKQTWKVNAGVIRENIQKLYKEKRLDKDHVWFSFFKSGIMEGPFKVDPTDGPGIERLIRSRKPYGPTDGVDLLQNLDMPQESVWRTFTEKGFNVVVINPFDELFFDRDSQGQITNLALERFNDTNIKFLEWINNQVVRQSLSQLQLIDLDFANKAFSGIGEVKSALGHVEEFFGDGGVTIQYRRYSNPSDLYGSF